MSSQRSGGPPGDRRAFSDRAPRTFETKSLEVYVDLGPNPVRAGRASFRVRGASLFTDFTYGDEYMTNPLAYPLSPALPFQHAVHVVRGLPGAVGDTTPDWWGRNLISRKLRAQAAAAGEQAPLVTEVDFLTGVSDRTRQGALRFLDVTRNAFVADTTDVPRLLDLPEIMAASGRLAELSAGQEHESTPPEMAASQAMKRLLEAGTATLGGARPKASVLDRGSLAIAKFPHPQDRWDVMAWEKTALDLAELSGIAVPGRRLETIDGRSVLILDRFDRAVAGNQRLGYISALTLMNVSSTAGNDYVDLSAAIADHSADADTDLVDLWRRMAFSVAIHNTDDHMRNHGFVRTAGGWRLSPAFDMNPNPELAESRSSSILGVIDARHEIDALYASAPHFGLTELGAQVIMGDISGAVGGWAAVARNNGIDDRQLRQFTPMFTYLEEQRGRR